MKGKICLCPSSIAWIIKHLKKSARPAFRKLMKLNKSTFRRSDLPANESERAFMFASRGKRRNGTKKKPRSAKQIRATKKLIAFNKRRRARR